MCPTVTGHDTREATSILQHEMIFTEHIKGMVMNCTCHRQTMGLVTTPTQTYIHTQNTRMRQWMHGP